MRRLGGAAQQFELGPAQRAAAGGDGVLEFVFDLPMPGVSYLELAQDGWL